MKRLGIITAGGDCPGLNAVIRAVVLRADSKGASVTGFENGFAGFVADWSHELDPAYCSRIMPWGGSILGCSGARPFETTEGVDAGRRVAEKHGLDCLVVVGGNTSMGTANTADSLGIPTLAVPKTIDNDVVGTDYTVGFSTAVSTATEAIDRLRTTAESHDRVMVVETMGRQVGWLAVAAGVAGSADIILAPEEPIVMEGVAARLRAAHNTGMTSSIVVVGEGADFQGSSLPDPTLGGPDRSSGVGHRVADAIAAETGFSTRVTVLGHIQRGGPPNSEDRILATRFGLKAADLALAGERGIMVAGSGGKLTTRPLSEVAGRTKPVDPDLLETALNICAWPKAE